jgi:hypothetical protein
MRTTATVAALVVGATALTVCGPLSAAEAGTGLGYSLTKVKVASGRAVVARWNPCQAAITYRVNLVGLPTAKRSAMRKQIQASFAKLSAADHITYRYTGNTEFVPRTTNLAKAPAEIVVAAVGNKATDMDLAKNMLGFGGISWSTWSGSAGEGAVVVRGFVLLSPSGMAATKPGFGRGVTQGNVILHELGHATGLEHASAKSELMNPTLTSSTPNGYGRGDLAGLEKIGEKGGCVKIPAAVRVADLN